MPYLDREDRRAYMREYMRGRRDKGQHKSRWVSDYDRYAVYDRDGWVCQLCHEPVDADADPQQDGKAPTLDHIVVQSSSDDAPDDSPENLRTAHRACNSSRGNEGGSAAAVAVKQAGLRPIDGGRESGDGSESAVAAVGRDLAGLSNTEGRASDIAAALALAEVLDDPRAAPQKPSAARQLTEIMASLREGAGNEQGKLATLRAARKPAG